MTPPLLVLFAIAFSAGVFYFVSSWILWVWLTWAITGFAACYLSRSRPLRILLFNIGAIALILAVTEVMLVLNAVGDRRQTFDPPTFVTKGPNLGHRAQPNSQVRARLLVGDEQRYDVVYTTDTHGLRIGPPESANDPKSCALFLGCSFTFGEGLNDNQTMPYVAGVAAGGRYRIRNFGFMGYGPHQMLAAIETGWIEEAANCEPKYAIYWAVGHHIIRAAGKWSWDETGPRYELQADGSVRRNGNFHPPDTTLAEAAKVSRLAGYVQDAQSLTAEDIELYFAIVRASRDKLAALYPGIEFHTLLWDTGTEPEMFIKQWRKDGIKLHRLSQILPDWGNRERLYQQPDDVHPNAAANELIGRYVAEHILEPRPRGEAPGS